MLIGYIGNIRKGKTLSAVRRAYYKYLKGFTIYSNMHLNFPYIPLTVDLIYEIALKGKFFNNAIFLIDEFHAWGMDSRSSHSKMSKIFSYMVLQSGKANIEILFTTQFKHLVDKRIRSVCDIWIRCSKRIIKTKQYIYLQYEIYDDDGFPHYKLFRYNSEKYYKFYNTQEMILMLKPPPEVEN